MPVEDTATASEDDTLLADATQLKNEAPYMLALWLVLLIDVCVGKLAKLDRHVGTLALVAVLGCTSHCPSGTQRACSLLSHRRNCDHRRLGGADPSSDATLCRSFTRHPDGAHGLAPRHAAHLYHPCVPPASLHQLDNLADCLRAWTHSRVGIHGFGRALWPEPHLLTLLGPARVAHVHLRPDRCVSYGLFRVFSRDTESF